MLALLGIAKKAGRIAAGEFRAEQAVKSGKASLVILSPEASGNTKKKFRNMCAFYGVPVCLYGGKEELGAAIGCSERSSLAVLDAGFSQSLLKKIEIVGDGGCENGKSQGK